LPALLLRVRDRPRRDRSNDRAHFGLYCDTSTRVKLRGRDRVNAAFSLALAAYNLKSKARAALLRCGTRSTRRDGLELRLRVEEDDETVFHVADQEGTVEHEHKREHEVLHGH